MSAFVVAVRKLQEIGGRGTTKQIAAASGFPPGEEGRRLALKALSWCAERYGFVRNVTPGRIGFGRGAPDGTTWALTERGLDYLDGRVRLEKVAAKTAGHPRTILRSTWLASLPRGLRLDDRRPIVINIQNGAST